MVDTKHPKQSRYNIVYTPLCIQCQEELTKEEAEARRENKEAPTNYKCNKCK